MQRKIGFILFGLGVCACIATVLHFAFAGTATVQPFTDAALGSSWHLMAGLTLVALLAGAYFVPGIIASRRGLKNTTGVILLNVLLGWTGLGWIAALIWSVSGETSMEASSKQPPYRSLATTLYTAPPPPPRI